MKEDKNKAKLIIAILKAKILLSKTKREWKKYEGKTKNK